MAESKSPSTTGKEIYRSKYQENLEWQAEWLRRGAMDKADSVEFFLHRNSLTPQSLLELGSGTGAVIKECQRRGLSEEYFANDYSAEAINYLNSHSNGIQTLVGDITATDFALSNRFDIVLMSHVLEHLEGPEEALRGAQNLDFEYLILEIPLENLLLGKVKSRFQDRSNHPAGHVQFLPRVPLKRFSDLVA